MNVRVIIQLLMVLLFGASEDVPIKEGKIIYRQVSRSDSSDRVPEADSLFPVRFTQFFKGQRYRLEIEFLSGKTEVVLGDSLSRTWLIERGTDKWAVSRKYEKLISTSFKPDENDSKNEKIEGYKCRPYVVRMNETAENRAFKCFRTDEIEAPHWFIPQTGILAFELKIGPHSMKYTAEKVESLSVAEIQLRIPAKFEKISEAEFYRRSAQEIR